MFLPRPTGWSWVTPAAGWALLVCSWWASPGNQKWEEVEEKEVQITKIEGIWFSLAFSKLPLIKSKCFPCVKKDCFHQSLGRLQDESPSFWCLHPFGSGTKTFLKLLLDIFLLLSASSFATTCKRRSKHRCWVNFQRNCSRAFCSLHVVSPSLFSRSIGSYLCLYCFVLILDLEIRRRTWQEYEGRKCEAISGIWRVFTFHSICFPWVWASSHPQVVLNISAEHVLWLLWDQERAKAGCHCLLHDHFLELQVSATH